MENVEKLSLVLMEAFHLYIEDRVGIHLDVIVFLDIFCQTQFVLVLDLHELLLGLGILCQGLQSGDLRQVCDPAVPYLGSHPVCQQRVAVQQESSLGNPVCLIVETLREHLIEIMQFFVLQDLCVEPGHTIHGIAGYNGHMGHLHLSIVENGHLADLLLYIHTVDAGILLLNLTDKTAVDLLHDLVDPGQQPGEQINRPFFQGFCHDGVVGIGTCLRGDLPGLLPGEFELIQQDPHQFRNGHRRMGIVELEGHLLIKVMDVIVFAHIFGHCFLDGGRDEEVLLLQAQFLTCIMIVVGIEHFHNIPGQVLLLYRLQVVPLVKRVKLEAIHRLCVPDPQGVHDPVAIPYNGKIKRNGLHRLVALLDKIVLPILPETYIHIAAKLHNLGILRPAQFEGIALCQPVIRYLYLITVPDLLFEHAVAVADATAVCRISQRSQGIQETCCQTAKAAIAQGCIRLLVLHQVKVKPHLLQGLPGRTISLHIDQAVAQGPAHKEFHGHIIHHLGILLLISLLGVHPVTDDPVLDGQGSGLENLPGRSLRQVLAVQRLHIIVHASLEQILVEFGCFLCLCFRICCLSIHCYRFCFGCLCL